MTYLSASLFHDMDLHGDNSPNTPLRATGSPTLSLPVLQPNNTTMQRYENLTNGVASHLWNAALATEMAHLTRAVDESRASAKQAVVETKENAANIAMTQRIVRSDMQILQDELENLRKEVRCRDQFLLALGLPNREAMGKPEARTISTQRAVEDDAKSDYTVRDDTPWINTALSTHDQRRAYDKTLDSHISKAPNTTSSEKASEIANMPQGIPQSVDMKLSEADVGPQTGARAGVTRHNEHTNVEDPKAPGQNETHLTSPQAHANKSGWQPVAVRQLGRSKVVVSPADSETFTWECISQNLNGEQWSPGFYFISKPSECPSSPLNGKAYWLLEGQFEPHLPAAPGQHGAKLTAFFNEPGAKPGHAPEEKDYNNLPVFICTPGSDDYTYFGHYRQHRLSDKVDYDTMHTHVPEEVRRYWAKLLTARDRPEWVTKRLMEHFWPRPSYSGPLSTDSAVVTPVTVMSEGTNTSASAVGKRVREALAEYTLELDQWESEARLKVSLLTADAVFDAFDNSDSDHIPGLRLWWEYLECVNWDDGFYHNMLDLKRGVNHHARPRKPKVKTAKKFAGPGCGSDKSAGYVHVPNTQGWQDYADAATAMPRSQREDVEDPTRERVKPDKPLYLPPHERRSMNNV